MIFLSGRRRIVTASDLVALADADGALCIYKFDEASGTFANYVGGGFDFSVVSSNITYQQAGVSGPDFYGALGSTTAAFGADFGHAEASQPNDINGCKTFSMEAVLDVNTATGGVIFYCDRSGGEVCSFHTSGGNLRAGIQISGAGFNSQVFSGVASPFVHVVATWDGDNFVGYLAGVQVFTAALGPGSSGILSANGQTMSVFGRTGFPFANLDVTLDFLAIYTTTVLSPAQVADHYAASNT